MKTIAAMLLLLAAALPLRAETKPDLRTITVTGLGEIKAVPDQAIFNISLSARNKVAAVAVDQVNKNAQALVAQLLKNGLEKKDITTTSGGVFPNYDNDTPGKIVTYTANYSVAVTFTNLQKMPDTMAQISALPGISNVNGPSFSFSDPLQYENAALTKAVENAKSKALALAKVGGLVLKEPITIRTSDASAPRPVMMAMPMRAKANFADVASAPMEAGEQTVSASVEVTFAAALP